MHKKKSMPGRRSFYTYMISLSLVMMFLFLMPGETLALHYIEEGNGCYSCHSLQTGAAGYEPDTSYIQRASRTLNQIKAAWDLTDGVPGNNQGSNGLAVPDEFGCTYCHNVTGNPSMKGVLDTFNADPPPTGFVGYSNHPLGYKWADNTDSENEYLSTWSSATAGELDCVDCHDTSFGSGPSSGAYPEHGAPSSPANNPYMLKDVTAADEYDNLCRDCHGSAPAVWWTKGNVSLTVHDDTTLTEDDGTPIKTSVCTDCHDTHDANAYKLFNDGNEGDTPINPSNSAACSTICHNRGDAAGVFDTYGHGKTPPTYNCGNCHQVNPAHDSDAGFASMLYVAEDPTDSKFGKSIKSICTNCHIGYTAHTGGSADVSCIDCHDEHAEGVGGATNRYMIPRQLPNNNDVYAPIGATELSHYDHALTMGDLHSDYYVDATGGHVDDSGFCDNTVCHAGVTGGPNNQLITPLDTFFDNLNHTEGDRPPEDNCGSCHKHNDSSGSWRASDSCTDCHGQPPVDAGTTAAGYAQHTEANTPHDMHVNVLGYSCSACHVKGTSADTHDTDPDTFESVWFDQGLNPDASVYPASDYDGNVCSNLYCHSSGAVFNAGGGGSVGSESWMTGVSTPDWSTVNLGCNACHGTGTVSGTLTYGAPDYANNPPVTPNSHDKHANYACSVCHYNVITDTNEADGWTLSTLSLHVNTVKNIQADGTTGTFTTGGATTCGSVSCHGGGDADWGATLTCSDCHLGVADLNNYVYNDATTAGINNVGEWDTTGHGLSDLSSYDSGNDGAGFTDCTTNCHTSSVLHGVGTNPFRLTTKGGSPITDFSDAADPQDDNTVCLDCHSATGAASASASTYVEENHAGTKHTLEADGGSFCWDCHDPHGDTEDYMVHGILGGSPGNGVTDVSDGQYGVPTSSRAVTGLNASDGYDSYDLVNGANTGLCQTCHAASGGASYYTRSLYTDPASHNSADTSLCTSCHEHTGDFAAGCSGCHGYPPPDSPWAGTTQTWVSDKAASPATVGEHGTHVGSGYYDTGGCNTTCHIVDTHLDNKTSANMGVKAATVAASTGIYQYSTVDNYDNWTNGGTAAITSIIDGTCANTLCHNSDYPTGNPNQYQSAANPTYTRYWNQNLDCYACHAYDGSDSALRPGAESDDIILTGSHGDHTDTYAMGCVECHPSGAYANNHKDGAVNFVTDFGGSRTGAAGGYYDQDGAPAYSTWSGTPIEGGHNYYCVNVYCHSTGDPRGAETIAYQNTTRWNTAASADCGDCHGVDGVLGAMATNVHEKHTATYGYDCAECHSTVVNATPAVISTALHVDGSNDVSLAEGTYAAAVGGTVLPDGGVCSSFYCHTNGTDWTAPYDVTSNPGTTADWDLGDGGLGCAGCHGNGPGYTNGTPKANSHAAHAGYACNTCHNAVVDATPAIISTALHVNGAYDLAASAGQFTLGNTPDPATPAQCNSVTCHGGGNAAWGATLTCSDCHLGAADLNNYVYNDATTAGVKNAGEWDATGHGLSNVSSYDSGNDGAGFTDCTTNCHTSSVLHGVGTNPFRLTTKGGSPITDFSDAADPQDDNTVCLDCHSATGAASASASTYVEENHFGTKHTLEADGGSFCWDCHDPHGDTEDYMVHGILGGSPGDGVTDASDGQYGVPASSRAVTGLNVSDGYDSYDLVNVANTGLCQTCHATSGGASYYTRSLYTDPASHNGADTQGCTVCHAHTGDFAPSGCDGCHGNGAGQNWPDSTPADEYEDREGAHNEHVAAIGTGNSACDTCHPGNPPAGHPDDSIAPARLINFDGVADLGSYKNMAGEAVDSDGQYNSATSTCTNIDCHAGYETANWYTSLPPVDTAPPVWSPGYSVTAVGGAGYATVSWNPATDATTPVKYDLYMSTTGTIASVFGGAPIQTDILNTSAVVGLSAGTYYFGVAAKDSVTPTPNETPKDEGISAGAVVTDLPGGCDTGTSTSYYAHGAAIDAGTDGTQNPTSSATNVAPGFGRQPMVLTPNETQFRVYYSATAGVPFTHTRVYADLGGEACIGPDATATVSTRCSSTTDAITLRLYEFDPVNDPQLGGRLIATSNTISSGWATSGIVEQSFNFTFPQQSIASGNLLVLQVDWTANSSATVRLYMGSATDPTGIGRTMLTTPVATGTPADVTAPTWTDGISNIAVADPETGSALNVSWNTATDEGTPNTPPVKYDLYRVQDAACAGLWAAPYKTDLAVTSIQDTGLTNDIPYCYGVRAKDSATPTPNETSNDLETSTGIPTYTPPSFDCGDCHLIPNDSGDHAEHANADTDYTDCYICHTDNGGSGYSTTPSGTHNDASVTMDAGVNYTGGTDGTCTIWCHGGAPSPAWGIGVTNCASCHLYPPDGTGGSTNHGATSPANIGITRLVDAHGDCDYCHGVSGDETGPPPTGWGTPVDKTADGGDAYVIATNHANGSVAMNGISPPDDGQNTNYNETLNRCDNAGCHDASWSFTSVQANTVELLELGSGECSACHDTGEGGAPIVNASSPHTDADGTGGVYAAGDCENCHVGHANSVTGANDIEVSTSPATFGLKYAGHGGGAIQLGGLASAGYSPTSEAAFCWGCHTGAGVTEWEDTGDSNDRYLPGTLTGGPDWTQATAWNSSIGQFSYKSGQVNSTHEAIESWAVDNGTDKAVSAAGLGCAACHNVHNIADANPDAAQHPMTTMKDSTDDSNTSTWGEVVSGTSATVFLRGKYVQSPYKNDGAPAATDFTQMNYAEANDSSYPFTSYITAGPMENPNKHLPASLANWYNLNTLITAAGSGDVDGPNLHLPGGTHIDDNTWGIVGSGYGHGNGRQNSTYTTTLSTPNTKDYVNYDTDSTLCTTCHAIGDLYTAWDGHGAVANNGTTARYNCYTSYQAYHQHKAEGALSSSQSPETEFRMINSTTYPNMVGYYQWSVDLTAQYVTATFTQNYHMFTCSKCHSPHASRLPYLRINNCFSRDGTWRSGDATIPYGDSVTNSDGTVIKSQLYFYCVDSGDSTTTVTGTSGDEGWHTGQTMNCHNSTGDTGATYWQDIP